MSRILREVWLFFWRDLTIARTYRTVFVLEALEAFFGTATFYYVARLVDSPAVQQALPQGESYFAFSLIGFVFLDYLNAALNTFDQSLVEARDSGTLEHVLVTQTSLPVFLAGSAIYPFVSTTVRIAVYIAWGALLFGFPLGQANWVAVTGMLIASLLAFSGLGILSASYVLLFKRGNPAKWLFLGFTSLDERHAVPCQRFAARVAIFGATQSGDVFAGCDARCAAGDASAGRRCGGRWECCWGSRRCCCRYRWRRLRGRCGGPRRRGR